MDQPDPPRKFYEFKDREFKRDNAPAGAAPPLPTAKELAMMAGPVTPASARAKAAPKRGDPNDVLTVLNQNRAAEKKLGKDQIEIREVKSRRKRDFWLLIVGGNLAIIGWVFLLGPNVITLVYGLAALVIFNLGLTWVMWQVMDRY
jgi:hypothetical protein